MSIMNAFRVDGKTALVTGCRRGIGRGFAQALADAGADIVGVSASLEAEGSEVERDVVGRGRTFRPYSCDFSDRAAVYDFIRRVDDEVGTIDILVSNAGTIRREPAAQHKDEDWDLVLEVNGLVQNEASDCREVPGRIALQSEGAHIEFQKVELRPIVAWRPAGRNIGAPVGE